LNPTLPRYGTDFIATPRPKLKLKLKLKLKTRNSKLETKKLTSIIIGTAGHIDHGKSALVRALTGTDPDRLP